MTGKTLFDKIISGEIPSYIVWEDKHYAAFLTPFANTLGATVVTPKQNPGAYAFELDDEALAGLMIATKKVANLLEKAFGVSRVAMVFEGQEVPHVHAKLYPMHGLEHDRSNFPKHTTFFPTYPGYIATMNGPQLSHDELVATQARIIAAAAESSAAENPEVDR